MPVLKELSVYGRIRGQEVGTIDTQVWDTTRRRVHMFYKCDFDHPLVLDLEEEFRKGPRTVELKDLFPNPVPYSTDWRDENGPVQRKPATE